MKNSKVFFGVYTVVGFIFILSFAQFITGEIESTSTVMMIDVVLAFFLVLFWKKFKKASAAMKSEKSTHEDSPMNLNV